MDLLQALVRTDQLDKIKKLSPGELNRLFISTSGQLTNILAEAILWNRYDIVYFLVGKVNIISNQDFIDLFSYCDAALIKKANKSIDTVSESEFTPLLHAIASGSETGFNFVLQFSPDINKKVNTKTPLYMASVGKNENILRTLIKFKVKYQEEDYANPPVNNVIRWSLWKNTERLIILFLNNFPIPDDICWNDIASIAINKQNIELLKIAIDNCSTATENLWLKKEYITEQNMLYNCVINNIFPNGDYSLLVNKEDCISHLKNVDPNHPCYLNIQDLLGHWYLNKKDIWTSIDYFFRAHNIPLVNRLCSEKIGIPLSKTQIDISLGLGQFLKTILKNI